MPTGETVPDPLDTDMTADVNAVKSPIHRRARRVLITQPIHAAAVARLRQAGHEVTDLRLPAPMTTTELLNHLADADALVCHLTDRIDEVVLSRRTLRVVATVSAGMDHIDLDAARRYGTRILNTPDVLTEATADFTLGLLLAVARRLPESDAVVRRGEFSGWKLMDDLMGADVTGATIGIIGMGRIGTAVAHRAHAAFDMTVLYHSSTAQPAVERACGARLVPMQELLAKADFVTLHAPLTAQTRHLIDAAALAVMQPHAYLINTSRGPLVDEGALVRALEAGVIAGAALDVFEHEPQVHPGLLARPERVVLTAHAGSATRRTREEMSRLAVTGIIDALAALDASDS
jgi:glyoxylate reductase